MKYLDGISLVSGIITIATAILNGVTNIPPSMAILIVCVGMIIAIIHLKYIQHQKYIQKAMDECGINLKTAFGEPYHIISALCSLKEHINDDIAIINEWIRRSDWMSFTHDMSYGQIGFNINLNKWKSLFKHDTRVFSQLDGLQAALMKITFTPNNKKGTMAFDCINDIPSNVRTEIYDRITEVLDTLYEYKSKYGLINHNNA